MILAGDLASETATQTFYPSEVTAQTDEGCNKKSCERFFIDVSGATERNYILIENERTELRQCSQTEMVDRPERPYKKIENEILTIFETANVEEFEDGEESDFDRGVVKTIELYGAAAIEVLHDLILRKLVCPEASGQALRILGSIDHRPTRTYRRWLLGHALKSCSAVEARDGANIGIAFMDDPGSISDLKEAIQNEKEVVLRKFMKQTLAQLENTQKCLSS